MPENSIKFLLRAIPTTTPARLIIVLPLGICWNGEFYVVEDANGITLAYVYFKDEPPLQQLFNESNDVSESNHNDAIRLDSSVCIFFASERLQRLPVRFELRAQMNLIGVVIFQRVVGDEYAHGLQ